MRTVTLTLSLTLTSHAGFIHRSRPLTCGSSMWTEGQTGQHAAFNEWTVINWTHMSQRKRNEVLIVRPVTVHSAMLRHRSYTDVGPLSQENRNQRNLQAQHSV